MSWNKQTCDNQKQQTERRRDGKNIERLDM
jgi:hypothetical protein